MMSPHHFLFLNPYAITCTCLQKALWTYLYFTFLFSQLVYWHFICILIQKKVDCTIYVISLTSACELTNPIENIFNHIKLCTFGQCLNKSNSVLLKKYNKDFFHRNNFKYKKWNTFTLIIPFIILYTQHIFFYLLITYTPEKITHKFINQIN